MINPIMINPINNAQKNTVGIEGVSRSHRAVGTIRYDILATAPTLLVGLHPAMLGSGDDAIPNPNAPAPGQSFELNLTQGAEWYFATLPDFMIRNRDPATAATTVAVTLDQAIITTIGATSQATEVVTVNGTVDPDATVAWASSNEAVATVDSATGVVTAVSNGPANIIGTFDNNGTPVPGIERIIVLDTNAGVESELGRLIRELDAANLALDIATTTLDSLGDYHKPCSISFLSSLVEDAEDELYLLYDDYDEPGSIEYLEAVRDAAQVVLDALPAEDRAGSSQEIALANANRALEAAIARRVILVGSPTVPGSIACLEAVQQDAEDEHRSLEGYYDELGSIAYLEEAVRIAQAALDNYNKPAGQPVATAPNYTANTTWNNGNWNKATRTFTGEGFTLQVSAANRSNATVTLSPNFDIVNHTNSNGQLEISMIIRTSNSDERPQVEVRNTGSNNVVKGTDAPYLITNMVTTITSTSTTVVNSDRRFTDRLRMGDVVITENSVNGIENGRFEIIAPLGFTFANTNNVTIAGDRGLSEVDFTVATATVTRNPNNSSSVIVDLEDIDLSEVDSQGAIVISGLELVADNDTVPAIAQDVYIKLANMVTTTTTSITSTTVANSDRRVTDRLRMGDVVVTENSVNGIERSIFEIIAPSGFTFANVTPKNVTIAGDRGLSEVDFTAAIDIVKRNPNNSPSVIVDLNAMDLSEVDSQGTMVISGLELVADNDTVPAIAQNVYISIANIVPTRPITNQSIRAGVRSNEST
jgi:hypothetical protein